MTCLTKMMIDLQPYISICIDSIRSTSADNAHGRSLEYYFPPDLPMNAQSLWIAYVPSNPEGKELIDDLTEGDDFSFPSEQALSAAGSSHSDRMMSCF